MKQQPENQCSLQTKRHLYPIQEFHFTQEGCFGDELPNHASSAIQNNVENMSSCSSFISHHDLRNILINISECVHPQVEKRFSWIYKAQSNALLFSILGDHSHYNIAQSLHVLRSACENNKRENVHSSGVNLLRRAFAVHVLNSQNSSPQPCQNSRVDTTATLQLYQDLCFSDINILPQARKSNAVNFYSFCLYQSERKRIRLHYIYPTTTTTNTTTTKSDSSNTTSQEDERTIPSHPHHVQQDQFPHDHYGNASSIILCGSLVNQFFQVKRVETIHSNTNCSAEYAMYKLCRGGKQEFQMLQRY
ncbi:hypothetical protein C9374_006351 [Naegleria lovaniensis]|uniref:Uncharacterized protein n=1 Tax=Naegleria lovaniensis TaxID=51637 RepID=A0AA88KHP6_NAELO|nr:uncharacterized protein C9374_006351 [Naegleria lovaniensis]KAG2381362.1 hypothetical protein C9374_006351 [Naegleria lovaniensis]